MFGPNVDTFPDYHAANLWVNGFRSFHENRNQYQPLGLDQPAFVMNNQNWSKKAFASQRYGPYIFKTRCKQKSSTGLQLVQLDPFYALSLHAISKASDVIPCSFVGLTIPEKCVKISWSSFKPFWINSIQSRQRRHFRQFVRTSINAARKWLV